MTISVLVLLVLAFTPALPGAAGLSGGWDSLARQVEVQRQASQADWIATTDYDTQGELSYHLPGSRVAGAVERVRYPWQGPLPGGTALIVVAADHDPDLSACFVDVQPLTTVSRGQPGGKRDFHLYSGVAKTFGCDSE